MNKEAKKKIKWIESFYRKCLYYQYAEEKPIKKHTILYQAYRPKIMAGNPYALFRAIIRSPEYDDYIHYWIYGSDDVLESEACKLYRDHPRVKWIKANSREHMKALATCEYLINNAALPDYWIKREGQIYVNTWHGTPLKALGKFANDRNSSSVTNAQRNFFMCDYMVMPNQYTIDKLLDSYDARYMVPGTIIDGGYPRVDLVLHTDQGRIRKALENKLGESLEGKKIVLYAPTFRTLKGKSVDSSNETCRYVEEMVEKMPGEYVVFFKIHNMLSAYFSKKERLKRRLIFDEIETNELLSVVDVLITDYSSIFFDYLCTGKPILFFVYDKEEYETEHGLYVPVDTMPGALCYTVDQLIENIHKMDHNTYHSDYEEKYASAVKTFAYHDDGKASERCLDIIFKHSKEYDSYLQYSRPEKKKLMLEAGELKSVTNRNLCLDILKRIDYNKYDVCISGRNLMHFNGEFMEICPDIKILCSPWRFRRTLKEAAIIKLKGKVPKNRFKHIYERQFKCLYGNHKFDVIINLFEKIGHWDKMIQVVDCGKKVLIANNKALLRDLLQEYKENYDEIYVVEEKAKRDKVQKLKEIAPCIQYVEMEKMLESTMDRKLRVLFLSAFDSTNYVFVNVIKELRKRGHFFTVIVRDEDDYINNKMYIEEGIPFVGVKEYSRRQLNDIDFVFSAPLQYAAYKKLWNKIREQNKFVITFASLFSSVVMRVNPDLCLCIGRSKIEEFKKYGLKYNFVAIGNPQYDSLIEAKQSGKYRPADTIRKVLIIDQGGYPFGAEGKQILGSLISRMAKNNPELHFVVKPRYVPGEEGKQLHKLSEHLYDFIPEVPDNLVLLREATILEELILHFDAAITTWSTAFLDAAVLDMPMILIKGLPSDDIFDVRRQRVEEAYETLERSGCVQDYHELMEGRLSFSRMDPRFLRDQVYSIEEACAPRVVNVLENIYKKIIIRDKRLGSYIEADYENMEEALERAKLHKAQNNKGTFTMIYRNSVNELMQQFVYESRCYGNRMDLKSLSPYWDYGITLHTTQEQVQAKLEELQRQMEEMKRELFSDKKLVKSDPILEDYYLDWLCEHGRYDEIQNYSSAQCQESLEFYAFVIALKKKEFDKAVEHLSEYKRMADQKSIHNFRKDRDIPLKYLEGEQWEFPLFEAMYKAKAYELLRWLTELKRYPKYIRTYYRMLVCLAEGNPEEAADTYENDGMKKQLSAYAKPGILSQGYAKMRAGYITKCNQLYTEIQGELAKKGKTGGKE